MGAERRLSLGLAEGREEASSLKLLQPELSGYGRCAVTKPPLHSLFVRYDEDVYDPDAHLPKPNRSLVYFGACLIAGMRLAREKQVNVRVVPTGTAIKESVDLAYEVYNCVFRRVPGELEKK